MIKLTKQDGTTKNNTVWGEGVAHSVPPCECPKMCSGDVLHAYTSLNLAFLMNPIHAGISDPRVFEAEGDVVVSDSLKVGCFTLTTTKEISAPAWVGSADENRVRVLFAVLCAESVLHLFEEKHPNDDRPRKAIEAARNYIGTNEYDAAYADAAYAAYAAGAAGAAAYATAAYATNAAYAAVYAVYAVDAADAAYVAAAAYAADATNAAAAADAAGIKINFDELADTAVNTIMKN